MQKRKSCGQFIFLLVTHIHVLAYLSTSTHQSLPVYRFFLARYADPSESPSSSNSRQVRKRAIGDRQNRLVSMVKSVWWCAVWCGAVSIAVGGCIVLGLVSSVSWCVVGVVQCSRAVVVVAGWEDAGCWNEDAGFVGRGRLGRGGVVRMGHWLPRWPFMRVWSWRISG